MNLDISIIINQMEMFATLLVFGILMQRSGLFTDDNITGIGALLTNVIIPCMVVTMMPNGGTVADILSCGSFAVAAALYMGGMILVSSVVSALLHIEDGAHRHMQTLISSFGNSGFIGSPITTVVYPQEAIANAVYVMIEAIYCWGFGPILASPEMKFNTSGLKKLRNPVMAAIVIGFVMTLLDIHPRGFVVWDTLTGIGRTTSYFAIFYVGLKVGQVGLKKLFNDKRILCSSLLKLLVFPVALYLILSRLQILTPSRLGVIMIMAVTPTPVSATLLAEMADGDRNYATAGTLLNTLFCIFTIPLVLQLVN